MIEDLSTLGEDINVQTELAVIGSGPAGIVVRWRQRRKASLLYYSRVESYLSTQLFRTYPRLPNGITTGMHRFLWQCDVS